MSTPLSSTDPKDIVIAAKCFIGCLPKGFRQPIKTFIHSQIGIQTNPTFPCNPPATPVILSVQPGPDNTTLVINWRQPGKKGANFIVSYTISYGTTSGGPYTSSVTINPGRRLIAIGGLLPGTTYFFVIKTNSFNSCTSAASSEASGTTTGGCNDGGVAAGWAGRVVTNGGAAVSAATQTAVCNFVAGAIADGFWNDLLIVNIFAPDNLIACKTPLKVAPTGPDPWTDAGVGTFAAADWSVNGLKGGVNQIGANIKSLKASQSVDSAVFAAVTNCGMTIYGSNVINASARDGACFNNVSSGLLFACNQGGNTLGSTYDAGLSVASPGAGYYSLNRTSNTAAAIYFANSVTAHSAIVSTGAGTTVGFTTFSLAVFDVFDGGATLGINTPDTISYASFHNGLSAAKSANQFTRVQALRTALGGGFV